MDLTSWDRHDRSMRMSYCLMPLVVLTLAGCQGVPVRSAAPVLTDLPISYEPFTRVHVEWKERLPQSYVYREVVGDYRRTRGQLDGFRREAYRFGLSLAGPGFCLFYDDPGETHRDQLRARICLPVHSGEDLPGPWAFDVLPRQTVVYAAVAGTHGKVPLSYSALFKYIAEHNWVPNGPIRELYLADPAVDSRIKSALTEVQIPWASGR